MLRFLTSLFSSSPSPSPCDDPSVMNEPTLSIGDDGPIVNIDGTPMIGSVDMHGCPYGVTLPSFGEVDAGSASSFTDPFAGTCADSWGGDSWGSIAGDGCGGDW